MRDARGGKLGFNAKFLVEMGEEIGSPDLSKVCASLRDELKADLLLASDGPRLQRTGRLSSSAAAAASASISM